MSVLQAAYNDLALTNSRLRAEIERLKAENARLRGPPFQAYEAITAERDRLRAEVERLRAYANHERSLGAEGPMIKLNDARHEVERLRCIIGDLLWAIGHDDEKILNETTARAKAALGPKPSVEAPEMCWHTENKPRTDHDEELWEEAFAEGWDRGRSTMRIENERLTSLLVEWENHAGPYKDAEIERLRSKIEALSIILELRWQDVERLEKEIEEWRTGERP